MGWGPPAESQDCEELVAGLELPMEKTAAQQRRIWVDLPAIGYLVAWNKNLSPHHPGLKFGSKRPEEYG